MLARALLIWGGVASWLGKGGMKSPWFSRSAAQPSFRSHTMAPRGARGPLLTRKCFFRRAAHCCQGLLWVGQSKRLSVISP